MSACLIHAYWNDRECIGCRYGTLEKELATLKQELELVKALAELNRKHGMEWMDKCIMAQNDLADARELLAKALSEDQGEAVDIVTRIEAFLEAKSTEGKEIKP